MNALPGPAYHFRTAEQWAGAAIGGLVERLCLDPALPSESGPISTCPIGSFALSPRGAIFLVDACGVLLAAGSEAPFAPAGGPLVGPVRRLIAGTRRVWALVGGAGESQSGRLLQLDAATLHALIDLPTPDVNDIAGDGRDGLWLLAGDRLRRLDESGVETADLPAPGCCASAVAAAGSRLALLSQDGRRLVLFDSAPGPAIALDLSSLAGSGWMGERARLSSAGGAFLLEGAVETCSGPAAVEPLFLLIGPGGDLLARGGWRDDRSPALLAATGSDLVALFDDADGRRILRFAGQAEPGGQRRLTPALETRSPAGRWLRAEVQAILPEHATLSLRWAASADAGLREAIEGSLTDPSRPMARRLDRAEALLTGKWSDDYTYIGARRDGPALPERFAFPLHEADGPMLWIDLQIRRNGADAPPRIETLLVLYEAASLMDDLPEIYSGEGDRDGTMRRMVSILEATTQGMDYLVGSLARRLDPERTSERWLPQLAAMLGLPFHEALSPAMQRRLVQAAAPILERRGTRLGLVAMLEALFPGRPVRVMDSTEQLVPLTLGRGAAGRNLPALLSGPSMRVPKLNARLVLARTALCPASACTDALIAPPPQVLVVIPATAGERRRYGDAVLPMAEAMIPAGVRLRLRWSPWRRGAGPVRDDVLATIDTPETIGIGTGPPLGRGRTGGRADAHLDGHGVTPAEHRLL